MSFTSDVAVYHNDPLSAYKAKAPTTPAAFDGSGDVWFKILDIGPIFPRGTWDLKRKLLNLIKFHHKYEQKIVNLAETHTFDLPACIPQATLSYESSNSAFITVASRNPAILHRMRADHSHWR